MSVEESTRRRGRRRGEVLARTSLAFGLTCIAVLGVLLSSREDPDLAVRLGGAMLGAAFMAIGLCVHGIALNDLIDLRRDLVLDPDRMLASGRIGPGQAALIASGALVLAVLGAALVGGQAVYVLVLLSGAVLVHNAMARFIPAIGLLMPGLLVAGLSMLTGWPPAVAWLPWTLFSTSVAVGLIVHLLGDKRPRPSPRAMAGLTIEWIVVSVLLLVLPVTASDGLTSLWGLAWPMGAIVVLVALLCVGFRHAGGSTRGTDGVIRTTGAWAGLFAAAWCLAVGASSWALAFACATVLMVVVLVLMREVAGAAGESVHWQ